MVLCGPRTSKSINIVWGCIRDANSQTPQSKPTESGTQGGGPSGLCSTKLWWLWDAGCLDPLVKGQSEIISGQINADWKMGNKFWGKNELLLGCGLQRSAGDQQREQMSTVSENQLLWLAKVQDMHLFPLELRARDCVLMWHWQLPELFLVLAFCFTGGKRKVLECSQRMQYLKRLRIQVFFSSRESNIKGAEWLTALWLTLQGRRQPHLQVA